MKKQSIFYNAVYLFMYIIAATVFAANSTENDHISSGTADKAIIWTFQTNGIVYATPLIQNNIVYIGSGDKKFYTLNATTGEEIWSFETSSGIRSTAVIDSDIVCFESGNTLYALDLDGNQLWQYDLCQGPFTQAIDDWDYFHSSPVVANGIVYAATQKGFVCGVDIQTGQETLKIQAPVTSNAIRVKPLVYDDKIYFGDWDGNFYAYDINTAELVWRYNTYPERLWTGGLPAIQTDPMVFDGNVIFSGRGCILYALDAQTGDKVWTHKSPTNEWLVGGISIVDDVLYLGSSNQKMLHSINPYTGAVNWTSKVDDGRIFGSATVLGDIVYVGSGYDQPLNGSLWALNKQTGEVVNRFHIKNQVQSSPIIVDGVIYFGCGDGCVYALDEETIRNVPRSNIYIKSNPIDLGDVMNNDAEFQGPYTVYNSGTASDSISLTWFGILQPKSAISIDPSDFVIAAQDSQVVNVSIDATQLSAGVGLFWMTMSVSYALLDNTRKVTVNYNVVDETNVEQDENKIPQAFALEQNYPNPFNPETRIGFSVPAISDVSVSIYNTSGQLVETLYNQTTQPGSYGINWKGDGLTTGTYFIKMIAGEYQQIRKCLFLK